jgi:hypothetical protein
MITIELVDEYVSEHEKPAAQKQADRQPALRRITVQSCAAILRQLAGLESVEAGRIQPVDIARAAHSAMSFWSRG